MTPNDDRPDFSFVVPLHNTGESLEPLLNAFRSADIPETWELILVDDGSTDETPVRAATMLQDFPSPFIMVELARNFGEHAAVLEGYRRARGSLIVNLDDDLQNPLSEALKLLRHLNNTTSEVVYSSYIKKQHHWLRNAGSWFANLCATLILGKPYGLYLSSFRAIRSPLAQRIVSYRGPYPHVDGLILGATNRIATLDVLHVERKLGCSGYTFRKLIRLSMSLIFDFSVMPLRLATLLGSFLCALGAIVLVEVLIETLVIGPRQMGWGSLMGALSIFSGAQLLILGIIGEYLGRAFLTISGKPQSLTRSVIQHPA